MSLVFLVFTFLLFYILVIYILVIIVYERQLLYVTQVIYLFEQ